MRKLIALVVLLLGVTTTSGCSALGLGSNLDKVSTSQNAANVREIAGDSERFAPPAELASVKTRNARAIELADKMDGAAK